MGLFSKFVKSKNDKAKPAPPVFTLAISTKYMPEDDVLTEKIEPIKGTDPELIIITTSLNFNIEEVAGKFASFFPKTPIIGLKVRGIIGTENSIVPKSGIGLIAFSREFFRASVWLPSNSQEHKIKQGIPAALENFIESSNKYSDKFPGMLNMGFWDSYQNGHLLIDTYEEKLNSHGIYNIPLTGVILHPGNPLKHIFLLYLQGDKIERIRNGFIFVSLFSKFNVKSKISLGLHPLIPFKITEAHDSVVAKLNYKPAFLAYKEYIMKKGISEGQLERDLPFIFATYQFGFPNPRDPRKPEVRIALKKTEEDGLQFNGDIPTGSTIWVMEANNKRMIEETMSLVDANFDGERRGGIVFSSIFRLIRMKNDYTKDIDSIRQVMEDSPFLMFNTYLEIYYKDSKQAYSNSSSNLINIFHE